ncbi:MAG: hypothetical protein HYS17_06125 [Micavibrio aeruginosavorus]|uniref:Uncharacterized protein n=1 Tax=Micavibrio aeruginosavorus TaxID=349221 RepID=A0A7T5UFG0_9BACT|nr:MAG: hypothetical protein HYS17_06125 [Micavibrio aeruginosavorus]
MSESDQSSEAVEIYHRVNRLKLKTGAGLHDGPGFIDPNAIVRADTIIQKKQSLYPKMVEESLNRLEDSWAQFKAAGSEGARREAIERIYHTSNHIKDLASTFNYELMQHFALSLREFAERIDPERKEHQVIVQAHLDVMRIVYQENIKDHGGAKAEELKLIVAKAIEKYS